MNKILLSETMVGNHFPHCLPALRMHGSEVHRPIVFQGQPSPHVHEHPHYLVVGQSQVGFVQLVWKYVHRFHQSYQRPCLPNLKLHLQQILVRAVF